MDIVALLDEIRAIARDGLHFAETEYDRERYDRLLRLASQSYGRWLSVPEEDLRSRFLEETGYITTKVGASAAIFNERGEILLMDRADGGGWCLPCGWVEPNERPCDAAVREALEETGLIVEIDRLVGVFSRPAGAETGPHAMIGIVHLARVAGGRLELSHEGKELRYWPLDAVPRWHGRHDRLARAAHALWTAPAGRPAVSD
jgi:ADP-ribose pyrophosphatase YjhB (NUDIX family)